MDNEVKYMFWVLLSMDNEVKNMFWLLLSADNEKEYMFCLSLSVDNGGIHLLDSLLTADERRKNWRRRGAATVFEVATR